MWLVLTIILINCVLAADNAVVIAMAARALRPDQRSAGIAAGAVFAAAVRVPLTFFAARLLAWPGLRVAGGVLIVILAVRLVRPGSRDWHWTDGVRGFWAVIGIIAAADLLMSLDNVLAVAAVAQGHGWLLLFGLGLSIPLVIFASQLLQRCLERWPFLLALGAAVLGRVGVLLILQDPWLEHRLRVRPDLGQGAAAVVAGLIFTGALIVRRPARPPPVRPTSGGRG